MPRRNVSRTGRKNETAEHKTRGERTSQQSWERTGGGNRETTAPRGVQERFLAKTTNPMKIGASVSRLLSYEGVEVGVPR